MTIEELPGSGGDRHSDGSPWTTTALVLSASTVLGMVMMWAIGSQAMLAPSTSPAESAGVARASPSQRPSQSAQPAVDWSEHLTPGVRHALVVDGVPLTYSVLSEWERYDELYMSKTIVGDDHAEAMVLWMRYPEGRLAQACDWSGDRPNGTTAERLATSLSTGVPGTVLVARPASDTVGGIGAIRVELSVQANYTCGPGYFLTWEGPGPGHGPSWFGATPGTRITIWVMDLGGDPFLIVIETNRNASAALVSEARHIIDSIEFR